MKRAADLMAQNASLDWQGEQSNGMLAVLAFEPPLASHGPVWPGLPLKSPLNGQLCESWMLTGTASTPPVQERVYAMPR
ncbi:MAG TPA: hypothetical protein VIL10_12530 [Marmoricola sp.]